MVTVRREFGHFIVEEQRTGRIGPVNPEVAAHTIAFFEHVGAHGGGNLTRGLFVRRWNGPGMAWRRRSGRCARKA